MKARHGFTLIELLVVIAIIAILAAILFPVFLHAKKTAQSSTCRSNMSQLGKALRMYQDDWMGSVPNMSGDCFWGQTKGNGCAGWCENLFRYHRKIELYKCPSRRVTFAYTMNEALDFLRTPPRPSQIIAMGEAPGTGEGDPTDPNNRYRGGTDMSTAKAGGQNDGWRCNISAGDLRPEENIIDHEHTRYHNSKYPNGSGEYGDAHWVFFPGPHGATNILFLDGHVNAFGDWSFGQMTFGWKYTDPRIASQPKPIKYK